MLWRWALALLRGGPGGLLLYTAQSELGARLLGAPLSQSSPKLAVTFQALFPALLVLSLVPLALLEASAAAMARAPVMETDRARGALFSGLGTAFVLIFAFSAMYVATQRDVSWDLSYFRTARPGESTRKIVRGLTEPLQVTLFFPPANEVGEAVAQYFRELGPESPQLQVERLDQAVEPARARALGVYHQRRRRPLARRAARGVHGGAGDRPGAGAAAAAGSGGAEAAAHGGPAAPRRLPHRRAMASAVMARATPGETARTGISQLKELLRGQNVEVQTLSAAEGLGSEVPRDAAAVMIVGPTKEFLPEEVAALREYFDRGGGCGSRWIRRAPRRTRCWRCWG